MLTIFFRAFEHLWAFEECSCSVVKGKWTRGDMYVAARRAFMTKDTLKSCARHAHEGCYCHRGRLCVASLFFHRYSDSVCLFACQLLVYVARDEYGKCTALQRSIFNFIAVGFVYNYALVFVALKDLLFIANVNLRFLLIIFPVYLIVWRADSEVLESLEAPGISCPSLPALLIAPIRTQIWSRSD